MTSVIKPNGSTSVENSQVRDRGCLLFHSVWIYPKTGLIGSLFKDGEIKDEVEGRSSPDFLDLGGFALGHIRYVTD